MNLVRIKYLLKEKTDTIEKRVVNLKHLVINTNENK